MLANADGYTFVRTNRDNVHLLVPLFEEVTGRAVTVDYFIKKYTTRWTKGGQFWGFLALNREGRAVAHQMGLPFMFQFGDQQVLAAQSCDSLTANELRGKGFFSVLAKMTNEMLRQEGAQFIFGFSNENSLAATTKLGWKFMEHLVGYKIKVRTVPLEKICRRVGVLYGPYLALVDFAFRKQRVAEPIPNSCIEGENGGIVRDEAFYEHRCFSFNRRVKVGGVRIWFKLFGQLCLGEIERVPEAEVLEMLSKLKRKCFWLGINEIVFQASPGTYHEVIFARHFPSFESWATLYSNFCSSVDFTELKLTFGDIDSF
jgi:hypothetical protein